jgi:plastocyanin
MTVAAAAAVSVGVLAGCGGEDSGTDEAERAVFGGQVSEIAMTDALKFEPQEITVSVGDRVQWRNVGNIAHTVTTDPSKVADPGGVSVPNGVKPWDSGLLGGDEKFSRTFERPGTYRYVCIPHEGARMVGTVVVEG